MRRAKTAQRRAPARASGGGTGEEASGTNRVQAGSANGQMVGLRERKKARLRQQIIETALHLFR
ncbi:MAG: hypothetical protein WBE12_14575, partial [Candidatus Acidiferrum sp.]